LHGSCFTMAVPSLVGLFTFLGILYAMHQRNDGQETGRSATNRVRY